jgi:putative ABC transport system permease protein
VLAGAPATYITSLHVPPEAEALRQKVVQTYPNVTVFDIGVIVSQIRQMLERTVTAVQLLFAFTLAAGVLVLAAALHATRDERMHEAAVMRALGARAELLQAALVRELLLCGILAGMLAAGAAVAMAGILADRVLQVELVSVWWPWPAGVVAGVLAALLAGRHTLSGVLRASPMSTLREVS